MPVNYRELVCSDFDPEACALLFSAAGDKFSSLLDFGIFCTDMADDEDKSTLIAPWDTEYYSLCPVLPVFKDEFWEDSGGTISSSERQAIQREEWIEILRFWNEWNNKFHVIRTESGYIGIAWWTTA